MAAETQETRFPEGRMRSAGIHDNSNNHIFDKIREIHGVFR